ncbi:hypothetical protein GCM10027592_21190 [Spirosoma flavus]
MHLVEIFTEGAAFNEEIALMTSWAFIGDYAIESAIGEHGKGRNTGKCSSIWQAVCYVTKVLFTNVVVIVQIKSVMVQINDEVLVLLEIRRAFDRFAF